MTSLSSGCVGWSTAKFRTQSARDRSSSVFAKAGKGRLPITLVDRKERINPDEVAQLLTYCDSNPCIAKAAIGDGETRGTHQGTYDAPCEPSALFRRKVRKAMQRSLVCVAAYVPQSRLPVGFHACTSSPSPPSKGSASGWLHSIAPGVFPELGPRTLVGFARAIGDAALVATIHDVVVLPEVRGLGIGKAVLGRLTRRLWDVGIIDVGAVVPEIAEPFFDACSFGDDQERSVLMRLNVPTGVEGLVQQEESDADVPHTEELAPERVMF
jgi:ribosomal protein S18 acetylase RimI-like enzyme